VAVNGQGVDGLRPRCQWTPAKVSKDSDRSKAESEELPQASGPVQKRQWEARPLTTMRICAKKFKKKIRLSPWPSTAKVILGLRPRCGRTPTGSGPTQKDSDKLQGRLRIVNGKLYYLAREHNILVVSIHAIELLHLRR
jgi:hypothetical protein